MQRLLVLVDYDHYVSKKLHQKLRSFCVCKYIYIYLKIHYIYIYVYIYMYIYVYICIYMYIYVCMYLFVYGVICFLPVYLKMIFAALMYILGSGRDRRICKEHVALYIDVE